MESNKRNALIVAIILSCLTALGGCSQNRPAPKAQEPADKRLPKVYRDLAIEKEDQTILVADCGGEPILLCFNFAPYPENSGVEDADVKLMEKFALSRERVLSSIDVSYRGKSFSVDVASKLLFASVNVVAPRGDDDSPAAASWSEADGRLAIAFSGGDGEGSYCGAVVIENGTFVGASIDYRETVRNEEDYLTEIEFAQKSLTDFTRF